MTVTSQQFADTAASYVQTPFRHRGRAPHIGLDCVGVPICAAWDCGLQVPDAYHYGPDPDPDGLLERVREVALPMDRLMDGSIALFSMRNHKPTHFGVVHDGHLVHACRVAGHVIVQRLARPWLTRLHSIWRIPGVRFDG